MHASNPQTSVELGCQNEPFAVQMAGKGFQFLQLGKLLVLRKLMVKPYNLTYTWGDMKERIFSSRTTNPTQYYPMLPVVGEFIARRLFKHDIWWYHATQHNTDNTIGIEHQIELDPIRFD